MQRRQRDGGAAAGQPHALGHFGDDADAREAFSCRGTSSTRASLPHVDRQRDRHAREHDRVVQRNESESAHEFRTPVEVRTLKCV